MGWNFGKDGHPGARIAWGPGVNNFSFFVRSARLAAPTRNLVTRRTMNASHSEEPEPLEIRMVSASDFDDLADIRIEAMQESLERVGRFDPDRARERLRASFDPNHTHWIVLGGRRTGFFATRLAGREIWLDHLYIRPAFQSRGIGSAILAIIFEMADELERPLMVGALKESRSNEFYRKNGFQFSHSSEWDNYYRREAKASRGSAR